MQDCILSLSSEARLQFVNGVQSGKIAEQLHELINQNRKNVANTWVSIVNLVQLVGGKMVSRL